MASPTDTTLSEQLVSIAKTLEQLPFGKTLLYDEIKRGHLKRVHVGKRAFILQSSIDQFLARLAEQAQ